MPVKKWKKKCLLECLFQKRVIYTHVNWEWNIGSNTGAIWYPCLPWHISHHTYQLGQSDFQYLCHPSYQLGQSYFQYLCHPLYNTIAIRFHPYACYLIFSTLPRQAILHTNLIIPLCTYQLGQFAWIVFLLGPTFYTILIFFQTKLFTPSKLKAHIANPTH